MTYEVVATSMHPVITTQVARRARPEDAFEVFFRESYDGLVRALTPVAGEVVAAEELVQEAMARAYDRWERVVAMESPVGYVYATAVNLHRRCRRRAIFRPPFERHQSAAADPAEAIVLRNDLLAAVARLPAGQRDALLLVEWLGVDSVSAGRILGIEPSSVRARVHRARAALQQQITR